MAAVTAFPKLVVVALAQLHKYLVTFNVADALRETRFFAKFTERTHMLLNANTLTNLYAPPCRTIYSADGCSTERSIVMKQTTVPKAR